MAVTISWGDLFLVKILWFNTIVLKTNQCTLDIALVR
jgi:hypothetical protein